MKERLYKFEEPPKVVILVEPSSLISQAEEKSCPAKKGK
jgi:hypothetical protein